jgi:DNA-binding NtrC family response regulator
MQVLKAWQAMLEAWNIDVRLATNGTEATAHLDSGFLPSVILCDQHLQSGESGFDILRVLLARCPQASGAMISGEHESRELESAEEEGYLVLRKPLEPAALYDIFAQWLSRPSLKEVERALD